MYIVLLVVRIILSIASIGAGIFFLVSDTEFRMFDIALGSSSSFAGWIFIGIGLLIFFSIISTLTHKRSTKTDLYNGKF